MPKHAILDEVVSAKHAWVSLEKIWMGQMGRLEGKIAALLLYCLHSFPLDCLIFSGRQSATDPTDCLLLGSWGKNGVNHLHGRCQTRTIICTWTVMCLGRHTEVLSSVRVQLLVAQ